MDPKTVFIIKQFLLVIAFITVGTITTLSTLIFAIVDYLIEHSKE